MLCVAAQVSQPCAHARWTRPQRPSLCCAWPRNRRVFSVGPATSPRTPPCSVVLYICADRGAGGADEAVARRTGGTVRCSNMTRGGHIHRGHTKGTPPHISWPAGYRHRACSALPLSSRLGYCHRSSRLGGGLVAGTKAPTEPSYLTTVMQGSCPCGRPCSHSAALYVLTVQLNVWIDDITMFVRRDPCV